MKVLRGMHGALALFCIMALLASPLLHSLVPHHHGSGHAHPGQASESSVWNDLHAAIQHEQKKSALIVSEFFIALAVLMGMALLRTPLPVPARALTRVDPHRGIMLRRGIQPYRSFR